MSFDDRDRGSIVLGKSYCQNCGDELGRYDFDAHYCKNCCSEPAPDLPYQGEPSAQEQAEECALAPRPIMRPWRSRY